MLSTVWNEIIVFNVSRITSGAHNETRLSYNHKFESSQLCCTNVIIEGIFKNVKVIYNYPVFRTFLKQIFTYLAAVVNH
jgi:hypothetical protein